MTNNPESLERSVVRSSVMPSLKYSCSGVPTHVGRTACTTIEGLSGRGSDGGCTSSVSRVED